MTRIAFLGLGAMGARMAARLLEAGHEVHVWNRTPARAEALAAVGATVAATPRAAAEGAGVVFAMVRNDAASQAVWLDEAEGALTAVAPEAVGVDCSTLSLGHVAGLAEAFGRAGRAFLDAPVAGSRPQAEAGQLIFLVGGAAPALARVRPLLEAMGSAVHHAGGNGAGATLKLMVNALFGIQLAAVAELIGFARDSGVDPEAAVGIIGQTPVCSPAAKVAAGAMLAGAFAPAFPIDLVAKDFALLDSSAAGVAAPLPLGTATGAIYKDAVTRGLGADNITGIVQLYGPPAT